MLADGVPCVATCFVRRHRLYSSPLSASEPVMGLTVLIIGLIVFIGAHAFVTYRDHRAALIARIGEKPYKALFSLVSIIGVVLIGWGFAHYRPTPWIDIWYPPAFMRHVTVLLMWPAIICVAAAYFPGDIKRILKHPF